jgi:hypothetical protein
MNVVGVVTDTKSCLAYTGPETYGVRTNLETGVFLLKSRRRCLAEREYDNVTLHYFKKKNTPLKHKFSNFNPN